MSSDSETLCKVSTEGMFSQFTTTTRLYSCVRVRQFDIALDAKISIAGVTVDALKFAANCRPIAGDSNQARFECVKIDFCALCDTHCGFICSREHHVDSLYHVGSECDSGSRPVSSERPRR